MLHLGDGASLPQHTMKPQDSAFRFRKGETIADLIAIGYLDETTAFAADEARRLATDLIIQPDAIAVIARGQGPQLPRHGSRGELVASRVGPHWPGGWCAARSPAALGARRSQQR